MGGICVAENASIGIGYFEKANACSVRKLNRPRCLQMLSDASSQWAILQIPAICRLEEAYESLEWKSI